MRLRYIYVTSTSIIDSSTGETLNIDGLESALITNPGGIIVGNNLYPVLAKIVPMIVSDHGWSATLKLQRKRKLSTNRVGGGIYFTRLTYRFPKVRRRGRRYRPACIKWTVINLELFSEIRDDEIREALNSLIRISELRGISLRATPGSYGGALFRASPHWTRSRSPAPWFISEKARNYLPGNFYAIRHGYDQLVVSTAYYLDQKSSHHSICNSYPIPDPSTIRARGNLRGVEKYHTPQWIDDVTILDNQVGLLFCVIYSEGIPASELHLYPKWCHTPGERFMWIWSPDLRLLGDRVKIRWVCAAMTGFRKDAVIQEYSSWCLSRLEEDLHPIVKPTMLAAYGLLAVNTTGDIHNYSIHGRGQSDNQVLCKLPLVGDCYRSTILPARHVPTIQNVIARGVIEAETRARSIEYARELENAGTRVSHIYADGLIAVTETVPSIPDNWRLVGRLTNVHSPMPNRIISDNMIRMPGIPSGRRHVRIEQTSKPLTGAGGLAMM